MARAIVHAGTSATNTGYKPPTGIFKEAADFTNKITKNTQSFLSSSWNKFTFWEPRLGESILSTVGKVSGISPETHPLQVLKGKEEFQGKQLINDAMGKLGQFMGQTPEEIKQNLNFPVANIASTIGGGAIDILTDPFMYIGLGEASKIGVITKDGERLGTLTQKGTDFLKTTLKEKDLTKVSEEALSGAKDLLAESYLKGDRALIDRGGLKFMGKSLITGKQFSSTMDALTSRMKDARLYNFISDSPQLSMVKGWMNTVFNPRYIKGGVVPQDIYDGYMGVLNANSQVIPDAVRKAIDFIGKNLGTENGSMFFDLANQGLLTKDLGRIGAKELTGKTIEELKSLSDTSIPDSVLRLYHDYINTWRTSNESRAGALGLTDTLDNYIKNYYPQVARPTEAYPRTPRPIREVTTGVFKKRLTDEEWYRGFLKEQGLDAKEINRAVIDNAESISAIAKSLRDVAGLSTDPYLALAKEEVEITLKENLHNYITKTLDRSGVLIKSGEVKAYQDAGYGIYRADSKTIYATANKTIADFLNKVTAPPTGLSKFIRDVDRKLTQKIVNIYFYHPASVSYHAMHNVAYNMWLSGGIEAFNNMTKGVEDVWRESEMYQRGIKSGALRQQYGGKTVEEILLKERGTPDAIKNAVDLINPVNSNHLMNRVFTGTDNAMRMALFRNALEKGATDSEASAFVRHWVGNHEDLTDTEKNIFRALYPYYSWFKTNVKANFGAWASTPERQLIPMKVWNSLNEAMSGKPIWKNDQGASWKINSGQKDSKGQTIYIDPRVAGSIVPQIVSNPGVLIDRMLSGPAENLLFTLATGKDIYETLHGFSPTEALPGAPLTARLAKAATIFLPYEMQTAIESNPDFLQLMTGWDRAHPEWQNIMNTLFLFNVKGAMSDAQKRAFQIKDEMKYRTAKMRADIRSSQK